MCMEKHVLVKNCLQPKSKRQFIKWKHTDFPEKKKFSMQRSIKKVMLKVFWNMKGLITVDFHEESATENRASVP